MLNSVVVTRVMRNVQLPEDGSTAAVQAQTDILSYINEVANDVWKRRWWREYIITGTYTVPVGVNRIALTSIVPDSGFTASGGRALSFYEVVGIRAGNTPLTPEDPGVINFLNASIWDQTATTPAKWVSFGRDGVRLLGGYQQATLLSFIGKAGFTEMTSSEEWVMDNEDALIEGATGMFIRDNDYDDNRAAGHFQLMEAEIQKMVDAAEAQAGNVKRLVPLFPWTDYPYGGNWNRLNISPTGIGFGNY